MVTPGPDAPGRPQGPPRPTKYARSLMTFPGPGALPERTGQRGHSALASSGARAGRAPVPGPAPEAGPQLGGPRALISVIFAVFALLLAVPSASATTTGQDKVHQQLTAPPECSWSLPGKCCPPGFYLSDDTGDCMSCTDGVDLTNHRNNYACRRCSRCNPGEVPTRSCTGIEDTECQCKSGTYRKRNSPELCRPCSSGCPDGMVQAKRCTPWSDLKCVKRESGNSQLVTGVIGGVVALFLCILLLLLFCHRRCILQACGVDPKRVDRVFSWCSCPRRGPGTRDNAHNEIVSNGNSQSTLVSEQELEQQEHAELAHVIVQSPGEAMRLLGPARARKVSDEKQAARSSNAVGHH